MSWTKLELVQKSFSEIGYAHYSFDLQPEQYQEALEIMDTMLSEWYKLGIDLSYPIPTSPGDSSLSEDSGITDAASAIYSNLALRIAPGKGKTVSAETKRLARTSYNTLIMEAAKSSLMNFPGNMPKGAGYKSWRAGQDPFYDEAAQGSSGAGGSRLSSASFTSNGDLLQGSGSSQFRVLKNKIDGGSAPTVTDDADAGYSVSSIWIDISADNAYLCVDSTAGAAVWIQTTVTENGTFSGPATSTDNAIVRFNGSDGDTGQNSLATIDDNGTINIPTGQTYKINNTAVVDQAVTQTATPTHADLTLSNLTASQAVVTDSNKKLTSRAIGIANTNLVRMDHATAADNDYAKLTADGIEGRSYTEVKQDLSLDNVENTALSSWAGSGNLNTYADFLIVPISDTTSDLAVATDQYTFTWPNFACTLTGISGNVITAPTGSSIIIDVNEGGSTIMTTNKIEIDAGETSSETAATPPTLTDTAIAANAVISIDIDQIGSGTAGAGAAVIFYFRRT